MRGGCGIFAWEFVLDESRVFPGISGFRVGSGFFALLSFSPVDAVVVFDDFVGLIVKFSNLLFPESMFGILDFDPTEFFPEDW